MAKSKVNASSTLALLSGMSTERQTKERAKKYDSLVKTDNAQRAKAAETAAEEEVPVTKSVSSGGRASGEALLEEERRSSAGEENDYGTVLRGNGTWKDKDTPVSRAVERSSNERADYRSSNAEAIKDTDVVKPGKTLFSTMVKEKKNVRKNFLLTSSNSEALRLEAENLGTSMNDLLNMILDDRYR